MTENQWTATTAQEAIDILDAALKLIEARMLTLYPGDYRARCKAQETQPVHLTVSLDVDLDSDVLKHATQLAATSQTTNVATGEIEKAARSRIRRSLGWNTNTN